jgi:predicted DNA-binding ArsR family transcriptional regulator
LLMKKGLIECRWRVQFAGSVARKKVVTSKRAMSTNFSTEVVEAEESSGNSSFGCAQDHRMFNR